MLSGVPSFPKWPMSPPEGHFAPLPLAVVALVVRVAPTSNLQVVIIIIVIIIFITLMISRIAIIFYILPFNVIRMGGCAIALTSLLLLAFWPWMEEEGRACCGTYIDRTSVSHRSSLVNTGMNLSLSLSLSRSLEGVSNLCHARESLSGNRIMIVLWSPLWAGRALPLSYTDTKNSGMVLESRKEKRSCAKDEFFSFALWFDRACCSFARLIEPRIPKKCCCLRIRRMTAAPPPPPPSRSRCVWRSWGRFRIWEVVGQWIALSIIFGDQPDIRFLSSTERQSRWLGLIEGCLDRLHRSIIENALYPSFLVWCGANDRGRPPRQDAYLFAIFMSQSHMMVRQRFSVFV